MSKNKPKTIDANRKWVTVRLRLRDVKFIIDELRSSAHVGAEDEAFLRIPEELREAVVRAEIE